MAPTKGFNILLVVLLSGVFLLVFNNFWQNPIYIWDEAIYANNALEMAENNRFLTLTLNNEPNFYNTKPPLAIWLMAISIEIFGANEFAVRLPSVLAFVLTIVVLIRFSKKHFTDYYPGILASVVLLGAKGLILSHGARSGDLDSLLVLCTTLVCLNSIELCLNNDPAQVNRYLKKGFLYILAGFFIKSTAIFLVLPGIIICLITSKKLITILKSKIFYIYSIFLLIIISGYYIIAEKLSPGYWHAAFFSEYQRLIVDIMPWHRQKFSWYIQNFFEERFKPYALFIVLSFIAGFVGRESTSKNIVKYIAIISVTYLLFISLVPDKLEWYDLPVYPLLSFSLGISVYKIIDQWSRTSIMKRILQIATLILFSLPIYNIAKNKYLAINELEQEAYCLKEIRKDFDDQRRLKVLMNTENPVHRLSCEFYIKAWKQEKDFFIVDYITQIQRGDTVLYCQNTKSDSLRNSFIRIDTIRRYSFGNLLKVY